MQTPVKSLRTVLTSDFDSTHNIFREATRKKRGENLNLDIESTPRRCEPYVLLKDRPLRKDEFQYIKVNRSKLIDWYLEICATYELGWECFWITVELVDTLIVEFDYLHLGNIHLAGIACVFIGAKFMGKKKLSLYAAFYGIGHEKFS